MFQISKTDFFTPPVIVNTMCDRLDPHISNPDKILLDLGCGTGNILLEALKRRLQKTSPSESKTLYITSRIYGADINSAYIKELRSKIETLVRDSFPSDFPYNYQFWPQLQNIITHNIFVTDLTDSPDKIYLVEWRRRSAFSFTGIRRTLKQTMFLESKNA